METRWAEEMMRNEGRRWLDGEVGSYIHSKLICALDLDLDLDLAWRPVASYGVAWRSMGTAWHGNSVRRCHCRRWRCGMDAECSILRAGSWVRSFGWGRRVAGERRWRVFWWLVIWTRRWVRSISRLSSGHTHRWIGERGENGGQHVVLLYSSCCDQHPAGAAAVTKPTIYFRPESLSAVPPYCKLLLTYLSVHRCR